MKSKLIIFVKNPALGKVKTRLAATIGKHGALAIYNLLLEKTRDVTQNLKVDKVVFYDQFQDQKDLWPNDKFQKKVQAKGDLGLKMQSAFQEAFNESYDKVCIIGSDCYDLIEDYLKLAFDTLDNDEAVIGRAKDGGYYLLGLSGYYPKLFENKQWSTHTVAMDTIKDFESLGISYSELPTLSDVDTEADLGEWAEHILKSRKDA